MLLLAAEKYKHMRVEADLGLARVAVAHGGAGEVVLDGAPGDLVTLLPVGTATGIVTAGLEYPLRRESLTPGTTRGVSNVMDSTRATVTLEQGTLLVIRPGGSS